MACGAQLKCLGLGDDVGEMGRHEKEEEEERGKYLTIRSCVSR